MPTNNDALLRYHIIDECLQNRYRSWTWEALAERCTEALSDAHGKSLKNSVSKRTIEHDIQMMRSDHLGYNAPIVRKNGEYYYEDKNYSIRNATISKKDVQNIAFVIKMLKTYKGINFLREIEDLINKLEKKVHLNTYNEVQKIISFEEIPPSGGQEFISPLLQAIQNRDVIKLSYQKFGSKEEKKHTLHPYFLKEYRNRWYLLGWYEDEKYIKTFALDRLNGFELVPELEYHEQHKPNPETYFRNTIGITLTGSEPEEIELKFVASKAPYIKSQPIHQSQQIIEESADSLTVRLKLTLNYELESLILSFVDEVEVIKPLTLREKIKSRVAKAAGKLGGSM